MEPLLAMAHTLMTRPEWSKNIYVYSEREAFEALYVLPLIRYDDTVHWLIDYIFDHTYDGIVPIERTAIQLQLARKVLWIALTRFVSEGNTTATVTVLHLLRHITEQVKRNE